MPIELVKDLFKVDQIVGANTTQTIIEGDILVPDTKPDITRVLSVDGTVQLTKQEITDHRMMVEGTLYFKILYVSDKGDQPLYSIDSSTSFKQDIELEGIKATMKGEVSTDIEHIDFTVNNERKIGVKAVLNLDGRGIEEKTIEITKDIVGLEDIQVLKEIFQYTDVVGVNKSETLVKDNFEMDEAEPEIREILKWDASVVEKETKITDGKVIVGGNVNIKLLYIEDSDENALRVVKRELPFTHFVEIQDAFSDMKPKLKLKVEEVYTDIKENIKGENKVVDLEAIVQVEAKVLDTQRREILVDTYSPQHPLKIEKSQIQINENIGMSRAHMLLRETLDIPSSSPPMAQIFTVNAKPVLTDYHLNENKVMIEGILETTVMYRAYEDLQPLYSFQQEIPFRQYIDIEGLKEDMEAEVDIFIEETNYDLVNGEQVEIKVNIGASCEAYCKKNIDVIANIEELEEKVDLSEKPSLTIYFMQSGDTLWKVAKKYHTTVKQIMETNDIEDPADVKVGDHIIIEKVYHFKF